ncbi:MAG: hypothetical protein HUU37_00835 [Bdellovibrionales bacterium]|nr:hypothetical protein [Bdellovibrionales bacterium]
MIQHLAAWIQARERWLEALCFSLLAAFLISRWVDRFMIWPDSAQYLTAAMNLVDHGSLFIWTNWPSYSYVPEPEVYAIYPPGFALWTAAFYLFLREPMLAAFTAQAAAILLFVVSFRALARRLGFPAWLRVALMGFVVVFPTYNEVFISLLSETLFMALSMLVAVKALDLLDRGWSRADLAQGLVALLLVSSVRWNGVANAAFFLLPLWRAHAGRMRAFGGMFFCALVALAPVAIWMTRNRLVTGRSAGHYRPEFFLWDRLWTPFEHTLMRWGLGSGWILALVLGLALVPVVRRGRGAALIFTGVLAHFLVIYLLTLVFAVTPLDDRYISPTYLFFIFLLGTASHGLCRGRLAHFSLAAVVFAQVALVPVRAIRNFRDWNEPPQRELWARLSDMDCCMGASHFYSDDDWVHQVFAGFPQRIVFEDMPARMPEKLRGLWAVGRNPFWVVREGTTVHRFLEESERTRLKNLRVERVGAYLVYFRSTSASEPSGSKPGRAPRESTRGSVGAPGSGT